MKWFIYSDRTLAANILSSILFLVVVVFLRIVFYRLINSREGLSVEDRRRWIVNTRNLFLLLYLASLIFIWAQELRTFAVSLFAVAVACVLATKELILCMSGTFFRTSSQAYKIGDRIEIGEFRGEVIDQSLLSTTLLEIGPGKGSNQRSGRSVVIPNSLLLNTAVVNETFMGDFVFHSVTVPLAKEDDWSLAEKVLMEAAHAECEGFLEEARDHMKKLERKSSLDAPSVDPRVSIELPEPHRVNLLLRFPATAERKVRMEQAIIRRFLENYKK